MLSQIQRITKHRLFQRSPDIQNNWQVIGWWELRRIPFNLIIGATGIFTLFAVAAISALASKYLGDPDIFPDPPFIAIFACIAYGVCANVCFTAGWTTELVSKAIWGERVGNIAEVSFTLGLVFSVFLTLSPIAISLGVLLIRLALHSAS